MRAVADVPVMNNSYAEVDGKPVVVTPDDVGLGLAIDLQNANGTRSLVVAAIKGADAMDFAQYWAAYEDIVRRARAGKLGADDFAGTTISLTNPGGIGTVHSVPRLMQGAGAIIGVGAMEYPAEFQGASEETLARLAVSKTITLTSTYDHRIIQGAQSGEFLRRMHQLLLGEDGFYDDVFRSAAHPVRAGALGAGPAGEPRGRPRQGDPRQRAHPRLPRARPPHGRHRPARVQGAQPPRPRRRQRTACRCGTSTASSPSAASPASAS